VCSVISLHVIRQFALFDAYLITSVGIFTLLFWVLMVSVYVLFSPVKYNELCYNVALYKVHKYVRGED